MKRLLTVVILSAALALVATGCNTGDAIASTAQVAAYLAANWSQLQQWDANLPADVDEIAAILRAAGYTLPADRQQILTLIAQAVQLILDFRRGSVAASLNVGIGDDSATHHALPLIPRNKYEADRLTAAAQTKGSSGRTALQILQAHAGGAALLDANHVAHVGGCAGR